MRLVEVQYCRLDPHQIAQKRLVADAGKALFLFLRGQAWKIINALLLYLNDLFAGLCGQRRRCQQLLERSGSNTGHQFIGAEGLLIEEHAPLQTELFVEMRVLGFFDEGRHVHAERGQQPRRMRSVGPRTVDVQGAAVH